MHGWENLKDEDRDIILRGIEEGSALGGPFHVELDPIDICNADCFFCNSAEIRNGAILEWERLGPLVEQFIAGGLRSFRIAGGGEPLMYPALGRLCERMARADVVLDNVTTNGIRMTGPTLEHLLQPRGTNYFVSLNYASAEQYGRFMRIPASRFDNVVENIGKLDAGLRRLGRRDKALIFTQFFIHHSTVGDLDAIADLARRLPVDSVALRPLSPLPPEEALTAEDKRILLERLPAMAERFRGGPWLELYFAGEGLQAECDAILRKLRFGDAPPAATAVEPGGIRPGSIEYCYIGWYSMSVLGTGKVHPCCFLLPNKKIPAFGDLRTQSVEEVWQGELYRRHREEMRTVMLMQRPTPGQHRRFRCTMPFCWGHDTCVLSHQMADFDFYKEAHTRLERLRRAPAMRLARIGNAASRRIIDGTRRLAGSAR